MISRTPIRLAPLLTAYDRLGTARGCIADAEWEHATAAMREFPR